MNDLKFAFRQLLKNPGFTAEAGLTLALCLGANTTIFAVIDAVLVRPLPFPEPGRLMTIFNTYPKAGIERNGASPRSRTIMNAGATSPHSPVSLSSVTERPSSGKRGQPIRWTLCACLRSFSQPSESVL